MSKKFLSVILVLGVVFSSASCAKKKPDNNGRGSARSKTVAEETEQEKDTVTEEMTTEGSATEEVIATETTVIADGTDTTAESSAEFEIEPADIVSIREPKPKSYDNVDNVTYLEEIPEDTTGLTEGPKEYHYGMGTIYVKYPGSNKTERRSDQWIC